MVWNQGWIWSKSNNYRPLGSVHAFAYFFRIWTIKKINQTGSKCPKRNHQTPCVIRISPGNVGEHIDDGQKRHFFCLLQLCLLYFIIKRCRRSSHFFLAILSLHFIVHSVVHSFDFIIRLLTYKASPIQAAFQFIAKMRDRMYQYICNKVYIVQYMSK